MRLLHVTDFHFNKPWFHWLSGQATHYDACCLSGDLLDMLNFGAPHFSIEHQTRWVRDWAAQFSGRLYLCSGNHDWWVSDTRKPDNPPVNEGRWLEGLRRDGVFVDQDADRLGQFQILCKPWVGQVEANLSKPWLDPVEEKPVPTILLAHAPPTRLNVSHNGWEDLGDFETDLALRSLPAGSIVLSGHIHSPLNWHDDRDGVQIFNPGAGDQNDTVPHFITLDFAKNRAVYFQMGEPRETVRLKGPPPPGE